MKEERTFTPGGKSRYAGKRMGHLTPGPAQARASWFVRFGFAAAAERNGFFRMNTRGVMERA
jgi:hypothetical protein